MCLFVAVFAQRVCLYQDAGGSNQILSRVHSTDTGWVQVLYSDRLNTIWLNGLFVDILRTTRDNRMRSLVNYLWIPYTQLHIPWKYEHYDILLGIHKRHTHARARTHTQTFYVEPY